MTLSKQASLSCLLSVALLLQPILAYQAQFSAQATRLLSAAPPTSNEWLHRTDDVAPLLEKLRSMSDPEKLPQFIDALETHANTGSIAEFDVAAKAKELGGEVEPIFAYVRDGVRFECYAGVLRGSRGTLMARAGNSYDRSVLLADLLREHGYTVRFARGQLDAERAQTLVSQMFHATDERTGPANDARGLATETSAEMGAGVDAFAQLVVARWITSLESVAEALRHSNLSVGQEPPVPLPTLLGEAQDHCWVEVQQDGRWMALDPCFADAVPGRSYAKATEHFESLPAAVHHQVAIRLQMEARGVGGLETSEVLQHSATAAALNGSAVSLTHEVETTAAEWSATPVLKVDEQVISGTKLSGSAGGLAGGAAQLGANVFNRARGENIERGITSMWLDVDFIAPDGAKETVRRELFDRIGLVARNEQRASAAPLAALPANGIPSAIAGVFAFSFSSGSLHPGLSKQRFAQLAQLLRKATAPPPARGSSNPPVTVEDSIRILATNLGMLAMSFHVCSKANLEMVNANGGLNGVRFYEASPRWAIAHLAPIDAGSTNTNSYELKLDLRRNALRAVSDEASGAQIVWANVMRGLLDAALEHVMMLDAGDPSRAGSSDVSTVLLVVQARQANVPFGMVMSQDDLMQREIPPDAKARLLQDFREPMALIAPNRSIAMGGVERFGWWRVDLRTGETLAVIDSGLYGAGWTIRGSSRLQDSVEIGFMGYVQAIVIVGCMTVFPAVFAAWLWGEMQSQSAYRRGFEDGLNRATDAMTTRYDVPDPRDGAIDYSRSPTTGEPNR